MAERRPPILEHPGAGRAVIEPLERFRNRDRIPSGCVLCFFLDVILKHEREGLLKPLLRLRSEGHPVQVYRLGRGARSLTVAFPGVGAPFAAAVLEELIALGGSRFIVCGGAGVLDGSIPAGRWILPTEALRAEGTSYHYQRRGRFSRPHPAAVAALAKACRVRGQAPLRTRTWTTDAVYRETPAMVRRRRAEGCLVVEMEAAALFAVARFRKVILGQLLYAGDDVSGSDWDQRGWTRRLDVRTELFELAVDACRRIEA